MKKQTKYLPPVKFYLQHKRVTQIISIVFWSNVGQHLFWFYAGSQEQ